MLEYRSGKEAGVAELVDARDLKSLVPHGTCGFDSRPPHHISNELVADADLLGREGCDVPGFVGRFHDKRVAAI